MPEPSASTSPPAGPAASTSPPAGPAPPPEHLSALTTLRFVAALLIVLGHGATYSTGAAAVVNRYPWADGVTWFFIHSGFVLLYRYPALDGGPERRRYLWARVARIYPLHLLTFLFAGVALGPPYGTSLTEGWLVLAQLTLTQSWSPDPACHLAFNRVAWSISVEAFLYAMFPLLLLGWRRAGWLVVGLALALHLALPLLVPTLPPQVFPPMQLLLFTLGMTACEAFRRLRPRVGLGVASGTLLEVVAVALVLGVQLGPTGGVSDLLLFVSMAGMSVVFGLERGLVSRALTHRWLVTLGEASYALYLVHQLVLRAWFAPHLRGSSPTVTFAAYVALSIGLSLLLWRFVEKPARAWLLARGPAPPAPPT